MSFLPVSTQGQVRRLAFVKCELNICVINRYMVDF